ncbi:TonB-dependent receptor plug domain-containing protein [Sphingomonas sp.]|uniref:TonB-dependent receptor plug domain-containing protein n=1 Tax=Sphingomonas sp. TaxID=28214 RepID=UPI00286CAF36|nr:TonB-dependent receptor plug domain-containing protein [Sphingomonas sp.]
MTRNILILLTSVSSVPAFAQTAATPAPDDAPSATAPEESDSEDAIIIVGQRQRATVIGDIPPENQLTTRDIRATGATSITELLAAIAPQIGSARGRGASQPVLLLNGQRISSFRELRDIPPEAIERVDILPEEVALKYGYRADQKVVNFVLRRRFNSTAIRADAGAATDGGYGSGLADATRFTIAGNTRTTINLHAEANGAVDEDERDISPTAGPIDQRGFRSLVGERRLVRGNLTATRTVFGDVGLTLNGEAEHSDGTSGLGFNAIPLLRETSTDSAHLGFSLNAAKGKWRLSSTGNADASHSETDSDRSVVQTDKARSTRTALAADATASGPLLKLPAGDASATFKLAADTLTLASGRSLTRNRGDGSANIDLPILKNSPIGKLTVNANAELEHLSDFGSLATYGAGLNWTPRDRLNLIASWTREEGAPTIAQLGDPRIDTANARVFDFTTGQTVNVTVTSGGNPALDADRRSVVKLGANYQPFAKSDLRFRADYVRSIIDRPISGLPGPSAALEAAFPDRFVRSGGNLISVDLRPVNFDQSRRETFRWGFDFTKPLKSARPSAAQIEQFRSRFAPPGGTPPQGQPSTDRPRAEGGGGNRGFGGGRGGGGFGGPNRGRLQLSLMHTVTLVDEATIRAGLPKLDYLHGDASGQAGGTPRHRVELQTGWSNNGLGARLSGNWRSDTRVEGGPNGDLKFSPLTTVDLRLFANLGERFDLVAKHPWLFGSSVRLEVDNLFNARPKVRDGVGGIPSSYQSDLLDPTGRIVMISLRKLFLPQRFRARSSESATTR